MSDRRAFDNPFKDFDGTESVLDPRTGNLASHIQNDLKTNLFKLLEVLECELLKHTDWRDSTVYTGTSGIALLYLHLSNILKDEEFLRKAWPYVDRQLPRLTYRECSFVLGDTGPLAVAAVMYHKCGRDEDARQLVSTILKFEERVTKPDGNVPDELLYGRVGYLYGLLFIQKYISNDVVPADTTRNITSAILKSGQSLSQKIKSPSPLMYIWYGTYYLGAAHGLCGILYILLQVRKFLTDTEVETLVKPSIDYFMSLQFPSGNFPCDVGDNEDQLLHWCHGAPGAIYLFVTAYKVFGEEQYLKVARACADVIWRRGILRKGYGICHGTAGNAYAFLLMYQTTKEEKYLYRAVRFATWCFDYGKHGCRRPDTPFSMFEGMAGTIYFLADLLNPLHAAFPAYQLD